jgi:hypothetical protein
MTSPELIHELRSSRPTAPADLRARVRELTATEAVRSPWPRLRLPALRVVAFAVPAAAALALASAGVLGLARSDGTVEAVPRDSTIGAPGYTNGKALPESAPATGTRGALTTTQDQAVGPATDRAQRVSATLTIEVRDSDAVSSAAQDILDLTRSLGGHVVSASVATGDVGTATLTVRVPVGKFQDAVVQLSALGRIASQQVTIDDLQESLDALERRKRSVTEQVVRISARLQTDSLDAETRAVLEARRRALRTELRQLRAGIASTNAEASMATIQVTVGTPGAFGAATPVDSRLDRTLDEALNVLVWEGVVTLAILIVAAPFALLGLAAWVGRRFYRRREEDRLLAT